MADRKALPVSEEDNSPRGDVATAQLEDAGLDELSKKLLSWSELWFGVSESGEPTAEDYRIRQHLLHWLSRCIGQEASAVLTDRVENVSLATSAPLLTAFLGRRAMLELSRRVLNDT
ncbi:MAG: hypothetical protein JST28_17055 [Acidobacteria bacterium]|nr:hypothetical protein [Acidobacteriota bacterium]